MVQRHFRFPASDNVKRIGQSLLRNYKCICREVHSSSLQSAYRIGDSYNGSYFRSGILTYRYGSTIRRQSLWNISDIRKFHSLSDSAIFLSKCRIDWKGILRIHAYGGLALSCINRAAMAVVFSLSRSHLIRPGLLAFIIKELAFSENEWALAEQLAETDTFYDRAQNGRLYFALLFLSLLEVAILFLRAIYLAILFSPCMAMAPFADSLGAKFRKFWLDILHHTLERAGPAFIKWGQWAATRPDLFPKDLCSQLAKLQTEAPAHGFDFTKRAVEGAFGRKLPEIFEKFEEKPVASGSVAQVHRATLKFQYPGQPIKPILVAVKVRHPGVGETIRRDFAIINFVARISNLVPTLRWLRLDESVQQFAVFMMSQVDLAREAAQLSRFLYNFRKWKDVSFPRPLYPLVHPAVLVETFEHGQSIMHYVDELEGNHDIKSSLANIGSNALLKMLLVDNFIHADMHPGNILVRLTRSKISQNQLFQSKPHVIFLDVGMTAELSKKDRLNLLEFFKAVAYMDGRTAAQCTLEFSKQQNCPNPKAFVEEVDKYFRHLVSPEGSGNHPADCMQYLLELVRHHKVNIDGNVCTVIVTTLVLEGWQRKLDPGYDVMNTLRTLLFKADWAESLAYTLETLASP
ncbi:ABC1 family protein YPL109C, mitochondrial-like protein [Drosera capensis]